MRSSIKLTLISLFILLSTVAAGQGIVSIVKLIAIRNNVADVSKNWLPSIDVVNRINTITGDYRILQFALVTNSADSTSLVRNISIFRQKMQDLDNARREYEPMITPGEERQTYDAFSNLWARYQETSEEILQLMGAGKKDEAFDLLTSPSTAKTYDDSGDLLDRDVAINKRGGDTSVGNTMDYISSTVMIAIAAMALAIATGIGALAYSIARVIKPISLLTSTMGVLAAGKLETDIPFAVRPDEVGEMARAVQVFKENGIKVRELNAQEAALQAKSADLQSSIAAVVSAAVAGDFTQRITKDYDNADLNRFAASVNELVTSVDNGIAETRRVVSALAEGDLTENMRGNFQGAFYELQQNVNATMTNLRSVLGEVRAAIDTINGGAGEMRIASGDLSQRTEQQAASLEETSSALEEITAAVKNSTERALEASHMVDEARHSTEQSSAVVKDAVSAMGRIEQASGEIGQIINVIDEIAFQTNLLALNAGVEAARAGEAGKGFAVVAQEVRELAQRSATAAKDIKSLISRSGDEVNSGVKLVTATGEALGLIQGHVIKINEHVHSIATAAKEQSTGLSEVSTAVNQMDQVTQQNAAMVEESTAATSRLADEATNLARLIARFKLNDGVSAPRATDRDSKPVASPARVLGRQLANAFGRRTATAAAASSWEEF
ncbi:methyl-accepting chemotaxis protein [Rhizobium sp. NPDC090279]|uniref:HAMP domain-containing methyl-accepting chemotaxis protein n=1 Tax=Rhizobium sp. NPDC090279 TaxID=3364499 RepID=UPI00383BB096